MKILTFDIEDWYHLLDIPMISDIRSWEKFPSRFEIYLQKILSLLEENNTKATFFWLGWLAERNPKLVQLISDSGHDIGSHSYSHQMISKQTCKQFKEDLNKSIDILQSITGQPVLMYRAPGFSIGRNQEWALDYLISAGIKYDSSIFMDKHQHGGVGKSSINMPYKIRTINGELIEYPIIPFRYKSFSYMFSGGGYFRITPYFIIEYLSNKMEYSMSYFHTRDFDDKQPVISDLKLIRKFKSYYGLGNTLYKFEKYLKMNKFISINQANKLLSW